MRVLLTGSEGFVGSAFRKWFALQDGIDVTQVDIMHPVDSWDFRNWCRYNMSGDNHYDLAIHCAAVVGGRASIDGTPFSVASNLALDYDFVNWARIAKPRKTVLFSSSAVYPIALQTGEPPMRLEESMINLNEAYEPDNSYGWAKLSLERLDRWADLGALILRPFSGYSHEQSTDYPFRAILERAKGKQDPLDVWSNGVRDWIHIDDIVAGVMAMVNQNVSGPVNLCTGIDTDFMQLAHLMASFVDGGFDYQPWVQVLNDKPTGVHYRVGDPSLMNRYYTHKIPLAMGVGRAFTTVPR